MTRKYFGTDGIRGLVGCSPMTPDFALKLGWAAGKVLAKDHGARVLIGKDTRLSGYMFESALEAGFSAAGVGVDLLGPIPTPGVAYLTRAFRAQAGVVISASHNPHHDNGVKFFSAQGDKLSDEVEAAIEALLDQEIGCVPADRIGRARRIEDASGRYIEYCKSTFPSQGSLAGLKIVVDCAHGAAYKTAPAVFEELGAQVFAVGNRPDGFNINRNCGSTHLGLLKAAVAEYKADIGIALDGDADRCLMVTHDAVEIDGDQILYIIAQARIAAGTLQGPIVGTQMSNLGLELALTGQGIGFLRSKVGDRYVMEMLREHQGMLGGETSGHTLCLDRSGSGDGTVTALQVLAAMVESGKSLAELASGMVKFPQLLINIKVSGSAKAVIAHPQVTAACAAAEEKLRGRGRVLLRPSGTEPLVRVMVESDDTELTRSTAEAIADAVRLVIN